MGNSRLKDFYDIWFLSKEFNYKGSKLQEAISETFTRRKTDIPDETPIALTEEFINDDRSQRNWRAFLNDLELTQNELPLSKVVNRIEEFVTPVFRSINSGDQFSQKWDPSEGWI